MRHCSAPLRRPELLHDFWLFGERRAIHGFSTRADAEEAEAHLKRTMRRRAAGLEALDARDTPRFSDWAAVTLKFQTQRKGIKQPEAARQNLRMILAFWGYKPSKDPVPGGPYRNLRLGDPIQKPELIEAFEDWMTTRKLSGTRKNHYRSACSMMYTVALLPPYRRRSGVRENPFQHVLRDRVKRRAYVPEFEDIQQWMTSAPVPVAIAVAIGLLSPALRFGNIVALTRQQISRDLMTLTVPHKMDRETGLPLVVAISPGLRRILTQIYTQRPDDPYVVPLEGAERYWQLQKLIRQSIKSAGLAYGRRHERGLTFHSLRHAVATWLARWRVSADLRQRALAHQSPQMTSWYTHLAGIDMAPTMALIDRRLPVAALIETRLKAAGMTLAVPPQSRQPTDSSPTRSSGPKTPTRRKRAS